MISTRSTAYSYHPYGSRTLAMPLAAQILATRDSEDGLAADKIRPGFVEIDLWETLYPSALAPHLLLYTCR